MNGMNSRNIIEKGFYSHPQTSGGVQLKQYIITKEGDKKCLLLRFFNDSELIINEMNITLTQQCGEESEPEKVKISLDGLNIHPGETFAMKNGVVISDSITDFTVEITEVISRDFVYKESGDSLVAKYDPRIKSSKKKSRVSRIVVKKKRVAITGLSALVAFIGIVLILLIGEYLSNRLFGSFSSAVLPLTRGF